MKKSLMMVFVLVFLGVVNSFGQDVTAVADSAALAERDSLSLMINAGGEILVDSTYVGKDIFSVLPQGDSGQGKVTVNQSAAIQDALYRKVNNNEIKPVSGYRIRIFLSSAQDAREKSITAASLFMKNYPGYPTYRKYVSPNFKVTVGDFRTKSDAFILLNRIKGDFPSAFIVQEDVALSY